MAAGHHIENRFLGISQRFIVRLTENLARRSKITLDIGHNAKFRKLKMADGRHFEMVNRYISADNHPFSMQFGMQTQILVLTKTVT